MSRKSDTKVLSVAIDEIVFEPNDRQRAAKASFWEVYVGGGAQKITKSLALQLTNNHGITRWWGIPGFEEWFCNKDEFRQRVAYLANIALDAIEEILLDPNANPNARQNAAKLMIEVANKMPNKNAKEKFLDAQIQEMGKRELDAFIENAQVKPLQLSTGDTPDGEAE